MTHNSMVTFIFKFSLRKVQYHVSSGQMRKKNRTKPCPYYPVLFQNFKNDILFFTYGRIEMQKMLSNKSDIITFICSFYHCTPENNDIALKKIYVLFVCMFITSKTPCWRWTSECALHVHCGARLPVMTCGNLSVDPSPTTYRIWTLPAQPFLRYRKWVCTCARTHVHLIPLMEAP